MESYNWTSREVPWKSFEDGFIHWSWEKQGGNSFNAQALDKQFSVQWSNENSCVILGGIWAKTWPPKPDCVLSAPTEELILIPVGVKMVTWSSLENTVTWRSGLHTCCYGDHDCSWQVRTCEKVGTVQLELLKALVENLVPEQRLPPWKDSRCDEYSCRRRFFFANWRLDSRAEVIRLVS